ncbi:MAG TPA: DUF1015 domain-containing protein [Acidimicrobiales bacterium]|nr:DUF1015 domain-containing protein [Acidimicrobiales bacterium]
MPRFEPFCGLRYLHERVHMDQVIAPPYDVVESAERVRLATRSPFNSILLELPEPDLVGGIDRYQVAAALLGRWRDQGVLVRDARPAFYPYTMTSPDGRSSTGVIGALGLVEPDRPGADVLPHEQTLPKPASDRLDLLSATRANLSPIWGLSLTSGLSALIEPTGRPAADATDDDGVRHQLWVVDDPALVDPITTAVAESPVVIADGHHRYATALAYRRQRAEAQLAAPGDDAVMALVVELVADQLTVGPIHRTVAGLPEGTDLVKVFAEWFDVVRAGPATDRVVGALGTSASLALLTGGGAWLLTPKEEAAEEADSDLDASLVDLALSAVPHTTAHRHTWQEAAAAVADGEAQAAVLLRPVTVDQIAEWAAAGRRMPPKTTYFSPKPRTGMVFRSLG